MACQICRHEPEILYAGSARIALGQRCYNRSVKNDLEWNEDVTLAELRKGIQEAGRK